MSKRVPLAATTTFQCGPGRSGVIGRRTAPTADCHQGQEPARSATGLPRPRRHPGAAPGTSDLIDGPPTANQNPRNPRTGGET